MNLLISEIKIFGLEGQFMKSAILFDTSVGSMNQGDNIIMDSVIRELSEVTEGYFCASFPTHTPSFNLFEKTQFNPRYRFVKNADLKFLCGTNLLHNKMFHPFNVWNIGITDISYLRGAIGVGIGCSEYNGNKQHLYSKILFMSILSDSCLHSVRDDATVDVMNKLGKKAINTGCATLWCMTPEKCALIPKDKADNVVFTITDYNKSPQSDSRMIETLKQRYKNLFFWPQGVGDFEYIKSLTDISNIKFISSNIRAYSQLLLNGNVDYIGTRLHAGIFAMQHNVRSIILSVDNRTRDMSKTYNLNAIERNEIDKLESLCCQPISTNVNINSKSIDLWLDQFK